MKKCFLMLTGLLLFRNATIALPKNAHMLWGGSFFYANCHTDFFLKLTFWHLLWTKGIQCLTSWNFELSLSRLHPQTYVPWHLLLSSVMLLSHFPRTALTGSWPSVHFPQRRIDFIDSLVLLKTRPPNIFPSFLYSNEPGCVEMPPRRSMHKSQQSLSGCMCVKRRVVKGLHAVCWTPPAGGSFLITSSLLSAARRGTTWRLPNRQSFEDR